LNIDNRIKFRHLLCFLEVSRQGSLVRAASVLMVTQPAISKSLKELEDILNASLFDRSKSGVTLTEAGRAFLRYVGPCVQSLREGVRSLREGEHESGLIRIGVLSTVESSLLPDTLRRLHAQHASLAVQAITGPGKHLLSLLRLGDLDLVVGRVSDNPQVEGLTFEHLYSDSMAIIVNASHELLSGSLHALDDYPVILPLPDTTIRRHADSLFVQLGLSLPKRRLETLSVALCRSYVLNSNAVWIAPRDAVRQDLLKGELAELDLGLKEPGGSVGICSNPAMPLSLAAQWCCEALREAAAPYRSGDL